MAGGVSVNGASIRPSSTTPRRNLDRNRCLKPPALTIVPFCWAQEVLVMGGANSAEPAPRTLRTRSGTWSDMEAMKVPRCSTQPRYYGAARSWLPGINGSRRLNWPKSMIPRQALASAWPHRGGGYLQTATRLLDGRVLIAGGLDSRDFRPGSCVFIILAPIRLATPAVFLRRGTARPLLVCGMAGCCSRAVSGTLFSPVLSYMSASGEWGATGSLHDAHASAHGHITA